MNAMCKAQSSPGHFAQYMDKNHNRLKKIRQLSIPNHANQYEL